MAKSVKKSKETAAKNVKTKSKVESRTRGRLIALEGTRGKDLSDVMKRLVRLLQNENGGAGYSTWDASNTFYELRIGKVKTPGPPVRSLLLLYASDLMFRLRWEIEPALKEGLTVIAAPYVESAMAMGAAAGLQRDWLTELFSFAPKPDAALRLKEKAKKKKSGKPADGFVEFCSASLAAGFQDMDPVELRGAVLKYLDAIEERKELLPVGKKLKKLAFNVG